MATSRKADRSDPSASAGAAVAGPRPAGHEGETVFAPSTAAGRAGIAVVRISGPDAGALLDAMTGRDRPAPRRASLVRLRDPRDGHAIDRALVLWFPAPHSFTGEDMVELHLHGGRAVSAAATEALAARAGVRLAQPGEFTRRAFDNGKLDLAEVEGLADLIAAETEAQRRQALRQMEGALSRRIEGWRQRLIRILALVEAEIDFPDEDLPGGLAAAAREEIDRLVKEIKEIVAGAGRGERLRAGLQVAIVGPPNVGKSSLLNALAKRDVAIVSAGAGTTRDVIELHMDLEGFPVTLADTAGLRHIAAETAGAGGAEVELEGMRRARTRAATADQRLVVLDAAAWSDPPAELGAFLEEGALLAINKIDLPAGETVGALLAGDGPVVPAAVRSAVQEGRAFGVSARTGQGVEDLLAALADAAAGAMALDEGGAGLTRARHRQALEGCLDALRQALVAAEVELAAEDLRLAARALGQVTGRVDVEDVLDALFAGFCIGK